MLDNSSVQYIWCVLGIIIVRSKQDNSAYQADKNKTYRQ